MENDLDSPGVCHLWLLGDWQICKIKSTKVGLRLLQYIVYFKLFSPSLTWWMLFLGL